MHVVVRRASQNELLLYTFMPVVLKLPNNVGDLSLTKVYFVKYISETCSSELYQKLALGSSLLDV